MAHPPLSPLTEHPAIIHLDRVAQSALEERRKLLGMFSKHRKGYWRGFPNLHSPLYHQTEDDDL